MQRMGAILILDNDCTIAELIGEILSDEGYFVRPSFDWASSRTISPAQPPALILLDCALPAATVAAVLEYARSLSFRVPVVITTTSPSTAVTSLVRGYAESLWCGARDDAEKGGANF